GRDVWDGSGLEREDDDVLLEDVVVLDVGAHRERGGCLAAVEEDGGAGASLEGWLHGVEVLDERAERSFLAFAEAGDKHASALPGGEDGEDDEADEQRQPGAVHELGQVGGEEEEVDGQERSGAWDHDPERRAPVVADDV